MKPFKPNAKQTKIVRSVFGRLLSADGATYCSLPLTIDEVRGKATFLAAHGIPSHFEHGAGPYYTLYV